MQVGPLKPLKHQRGAQDRGFAAARGSKRRWLTYANLARQTPATTTPACRRGQSGIKNVWVAAPRSHFAKAVAVPHQSGAGRNFGVVTTTLGPARRSEAYAPTNAEISDKKNAEKRFFRAFLTLKKRVLSVKITRKRVFFSHPPSRNALFCYSEFLSVRY